MMSIRYRGRAPDPVKAKVVGVVAAWMATMWSFPLLLRLIDRIRGMWERVRSQQTSLNVPSVCLLLYIAQYDRGPKL
jgi:hypothetical protein